MMIRSLLPLAALLPLVAVAQAPDPGLQSVVAHLKALDTMTADFVQTDRSGRTTTGKLTLKRPGKIRFQYQQGVPILVVADGKALHFIDYKVRQHSRWPIGNSPLGVLLNPDINVARYAKVMPSGNRQTLFAQARDPKHPEYGTITLAFARVPGAPGGLRLDGWTMRDAQNNMTAVKLTNQRFNVPVADRAFAFNPPQRAVPRTR